MSKNEKNVKNEMLTIEDILKRKDYFKSRQTETFVVYAQQLDKNIRLRCLNASEWEQANEVTYNSDINPDAFALTIALVDPDPKDSRLKEALGAATALDVINTLFKPGEISSMAQLVLNKSGYNQVTEIKEIKN